VVFTFVPDRHHSHSQKDGNVQQTNIVKLVFSCACFDGLRFAVRSVVGFEFALCAAEV
jgi:hypothetical protein